MSTLAPMPPASLERLADLLRRVVEASVAAPEPPGKWCIALSRRTDRDKSAHIVVKIDQYLNNLHSYRDDAHLAAWRLCGLSGQAWEALTFIWRGEAATLDDLYEKLERHGHPRSVCMDALHDLVKRRLIEEESGTYRITEQGRTLRQEAEETTDRYFYAPWACLNEDETSELQTLLTRLRDGLR